MSHLVYKTLIFVKFDRSYCRQPYHQIFFFQRLIPELKPNLQVTLRCETRGIFQNVQIIN